MSIRSKLFATVAFPMLSMSIAIQPALADSLTKPFEVAQDNSATRPEGGEQQPEELRKKRKANAEQTEEKAQSEKAQPEEEQPRRKKRQDAEQQDAQPNDQEQPSRAERKKRAQAEEQQNEAQPAQDEQPSRAERKKRADAEKQDQAKPAGDDDAAKAADDKAKARAERKKRQDAENQDQAKPAGDDAATTAADDKAKARAERKKRQDAENQDQAKPAGDDAATTAADDKAKARAERKKRQDAENQDQAKPAGDDAATTAADDKAKVRAERKKRADAENQANDEARPSSDDDATRKTADERKRERAEQKAKADADQQGKRPVNEDGLRPAVGGDETDGEVRKPRDRRDPVPEVVDTRSKEEKQKLARDPSKSDDTIVLPVDNGAAVLDSDKDADNAGDTSVRDKRRQQRERARADEDQTEVPKSDAEAQSRRKDRRPTREELNAGIKEEGRRIDNVPEFNIPDMIDAMTGNDGRRPRIDDSRDNRTVLDFGDQIIVRGDDRPRLRRNAQETYYEQLSGDRSRETIERPNGIRIVTIYNRYGDIVQRSRIDRDGQETLMIYAPEDDSGRRVPSYDAGEDLPPMRLRVPVRDYIIDTSSEPDRDYYEFLAEPPVEQVERTYTIDEVRNSARIRDKVRRIDLDTVTFATNSAEVPLSQAKTLRKVADAMLEVIEKDPGETFFIEGHTDAVGGEEPNLVLSDERAESVASLLTDVYDIPAENLVTQGYGERFLKVRTTEAEQQNRRVTIRRVTPLVRPVAQN